MNQRQIGLFLFCAVAGSFATPTTSAEARDASPSNSASPRHHEFVLDPSLPRADVAPAGAESHCGAWTRGPFRSIQVNVDAEGCNILGDAANEPSIAIDPTDPSRIVIGWRQFDNVASDFRQPGYAYSIDRGETWTFPGAVAPGVWGSNPVLAAGPNGEFYFLSAGSDRLRLYKSLDGGSTWGAATQVQAGLCDKPWMGVDTTSGPARGNIYVTWRPQFSHGRLLRSSNGGVSFVAADRGGSECGTVAVGPEGEVYVANTQYGACRATSPADSTQPALFEACGGYPGGECVHGGQANPDGLVYQSWLAVDHSQGIRRGTVYSLDGTHFARSVTRASAWSSAVNVADDFSGTQWFGTLSVAPNGRIDVVWNDTRASGLDNVCEVYYSFSLDGGETWSRNLPVSPSFDSRVGWPGDDHKLGNYYHMQSLDDGAYLAYAATFNGEQDIYFLWIPVGDCDGDGISDHDELAGDPSQAMDCTGNGLPDNCESDCNHNDVADSCDIASGTSFDCSNNGVPDECEPDCNNNDIADTCDIASAMSPDCNVNDRPDECDGFFFMDRDCNHNGRPDSCDIADRISTDCDADRLLNDCEFSFQDCNLNCVLDRLEVENYGEITTFATGFEAPQDIVASQGGFPPGYFVSDFWDGVVFHVTPDGKTVTPFVEDLGDLLVSISFVPDDFGGGGVRLAVLGTSGVGILLVDATSSSSLLPLEADCELTYGLTYIPVTQDGTAANRLVYSCQSTTGTTLIAVDANGAFETLGSTVTRSFGSPFAFDVVDSPPTFTGHAGRLFMSETAGNRIYELNGNRLEAFIRVPIVAQNGGLRQLAFSPVGWAGLLSPHLVTQSVLLVSKSANQTGGAGQGGVEIWDSEGRLMATLSRGVGGAAINPRGLLVVNDAVLIADSTTGRVIRAPLRSFGIPNCRNPSMLDICEVALYPEDDCSRNGIPDSCELSGVLKSDCNNNGIVDGCEIRLNAALDCDYDLWLDSCQVAATYDCNENGVPDGCDVVFGPGADCDGNRRPDECDSDNDEDGSPDACDADIDGDQVPNADDICPTWPVGPPVDLAGRPLGDLSLNCYLGLSDYELLLDYWILSGPGVAPQPPGEAADFDSDADVDLHDFFSFQLYYR